MRDARDAEDALLLQNGDHAALIAAYHESSCQRCRVACGPMPGTTSHRTSSSGSQGARPGASATRCRTGSSCTRSIDWTIKEHFQGSPTECRSPRLGPRRRGRSVPPLEDDAGARPAVRRPPRRSRRVLELRYRDGLEIDEIAERLGMTRNAVDQALHRGHAKLRECIREADGPSTSSSTSGRPATRAANIPTRSLPRTRRRRRRRAVRPDGHLPAGRAAGRADRGDVLLARAWVAGASPLVELRASRGVRRDDVVDAVVEEFEIAPDRREKVRALLPRARVRAARPGRPRPPPRRPDRSHPERLTDAIVGLRPRALPPRPPSVRSCDDGPAKHVVEHHGRGGPASATPLRHRLGWACDRACDGDGDRDRECCFRLDDRPGLRVGDDTVVARALQRDRLDDGLTSRSAHDSLLDGDAPAAWAARTQPSFLSHRPGPRPRCSHQAHT